jgi:S-adenosylmethionine decarboxylase
LTALAKHLLLELKECDAQLLNDVEYLRKTLREIAQIIGATVIKDDFYQFTPQGVSGLVIIAESHISVHTWPEHNYAAVDVFTCGDLIEPKNAIKPMVAKLCAGSSSYREIKRGLIHEGKLAVG